MTSRKPLQHVARYQIRASAKPTAVSIGRMFMTPISRRALSPGACDRFARTQATCGNPRPTTTTSPSRSSLAPAVAIISDASTSGIFLLSSTYWIEIRSAGAYQKSRNIFKRVSVQKLRGLRRILRLPAIILELRPSQFGPANFARAGLWQFRNELDFSRIFVPGKFLTHEILQLFLQIVRRLMLAVNNDERLRNHSVQFVRGSNNRGLQHTRMLKQYAFNFQSSDIDASTNDHVVVSALIMKESVTIANVDIAWNIPALPNVLLLIILQMQVTAPGGSLDCKKSRLTIRRRLHCFLIDNLGNVTGNCFSCCTRTRTARTRRNENVEHLRRSETVENLDPRGRAPCPINRRRQRFARIDHKPQ